MENFELKLAGMSSVLLIGENGSGKSAVGQALEVLQKIGRGTSRVSELVKVKDFSGGRADVPMRFEVETEFDGKVYEYVVAFELPTGGSDILLREERLTADGKVVYRRERTKVELPVLVPKESTADPLKDMYSAALDLGITQTVSLHNQTVGLPIIQEQFLGARPDRVHLFRYWLARILILRPIPALMKGDADPKVSEPNSSVSDFGAWYSGLLSHVPAAYAKMVDFLRQVMPDLKELKRPVTGENAGRLQVEFSTGKGSVTVGLEDLSDGEKCFMVCALVLAENAGFPRICFWDEPDNYLALSEVGDFVMELRRAFQSGGQFIATSHNPEAIRHFTRDSTLLLFRRNHLEPTVVRPVEELKFHGDLVGALIRGDVEP